MSYCQANMFRFAHSEKDYLLKLAVQSRKLVGEGLALTDCNPLWFDSVILPHGGLSDPPILQGLLNIINKEEEFSWIGLFWNIPSFSWITNTPLLVPSGFKGVQSAALACFASREKCSVLSSSLQTKWLVTLDKLDLPIIPNNWFDGISKLLVVAPIFHRMCWLKSISGGWTTAVRLSIHEGRGCCFGCTDARDEITHYLQCPILWLFARESLKAEEESICCFERLGLLNPTPLKLKLLSFCHSLYHTVIHDSICVLADGSFAAPPVVQCRASEICDYCRFLVGGIRGCIADKVMTTPCDTVSLS